MHVCMYVCMYVSKVSKTRWAERLPCFGEMKNAYNNVSENLKRKDNS